MRSSTGRRSSGDRLWLMVWELGSAVVVFMAPALLAASRVGIRKTPDPTLIPPPEDQGLPGWPGRPPRRDDGSVEEPTGWMPPWEASRQQDGPRPQERWPGPPQFRRHGPRRWRTDRGPLR